MEEVVPAAAGLEFGAQGLGFFFFKVHRTFDGSGFRAKVQGLGFGVQGL